ncbi:multi-sensor signal transduction histidine kinase [Syntrophobotulus glycolicus DSM 8271]|uniref:histidine kinase n=1 Tax=Syntrophobotulus glycolicus (strain DSM 8271 / FlGlyR) TaxID=645991 RepID=F0T0I3_SYNGF|nr:ATP-binding protein [Syntrophobotulus glycolicus]ADY55048.1 multi-sensor signal transduction histidine kinase [Syntrophobotulus glycolicus DSM 8271]
MNIFTQKRNLLPVNPRKAKGTSIVESALVKVSLVVFFIFIFLYMFMYNSYWNREMYQKKLELSNITFNLHQTISKELDQFYDSDHYRDLTLEEKNREISVLISPVLDEYTQKYPTINLGYINFDTGLRISNDIANDPSFPGVRPSPEEFLMEYNYTDSSANKCIANLLALNIENQNAGYVWAKLNSAYIFYHTQLNLAVLLGSSILLLILILLLIRRLISQIKGELVAFSQNITSNENQRNEFAMDKLPELAPVFRQIQDHSVSLRNLHDELLTIMDGISDGFFSLDSDLNFRFVNDTIKKTFEEEFVGRNFRGSVFHDLFPELETILQSTVQNNKPLFWETTLPDNREFEFNAYPFSQGISVFFRDTTAINRQARELICLERLNLIGQMAAGISHEVRNPMTTVKGFLQIFFVNPTCQELQEDITLMISEIDRANAIINDFLSLAKASTQNHELRNINQIIERIFPLVRADAYNSNKDIDLKLSEVPEILLNESEIKQVLLNFIRNGLEASPPGASMEISTYLEENTLVLEIKDAGHGLCQKVRDSFGTPFLTTKENGTGLGLAISIGILNRHNATIKYDTGEKGTTFYIRFALSNEEQKEEPQTD